MNSPIENIAADPKINEVLAATLPAVNSYQYYNSMKLLTLVELSPGSESIVIAVEIDVVDVALGELNSVNHRVVKLSKLLTNPPCQTIETCNQVRNIVICNCSRRWGAIACLSFDSTTYIVMSYKELAISSILLKYYQKAHGEAKVAAHRIGRQQ
jgi:hypothetical protein